MTSDVAERNDASNFVEIFSGKIWTMPTKVHKCFFPNRCTRELSRANMDMSQMPILGYGHSTPKTIWGRLFTMFYASFGIPLGLVMFNSIGDKLTIDHLHPIHGHNHHQQPIIPHLLWPRHVQLNWLWHHLLKCCANIVDSIHLQKLTCCV